MRAAVGVDHGGPLHRAQMQRLVPEEPGHKDQDHVGKGGTENGQCQPQQPLMGKIHLKGVQNGAGTDDGHNDLGKPLAGGGGHDFGLNGQKTNEQHQKHLYDLLKEKNSHLGQKPPE